MPLPIEVSEMVIDQASDDTLSLRNLSLTCAAFLPRSRYHLFTSIHIQSVEQMESSRDFLDTHPWLLPLVHKVSLSFRVPKDYSKPNVRVFDVVPVDLLTRLPNLFMWMMGPVYEPEWTVSPSFHHSALSLYRSNSSCIQSLSLRSTQFYCLSDFTGLLSAFTSIRTLTCCNIVFRQKEKPDASESYVGGTGMLTRPTQVSTLILIGSGTDIRAVEYMLFRCGASLSSLSIDLGGDCERVETSMGWLSQLSSLELVIRPSNVQRFSKRISSAARILKSVERTCLTDLRVIFQLDTIVELVSCLSGPDAPSDDCRLLEETLLAFKCPNFSVVALVREDGCSQREERAEFWSPTIKHAFPVLNERGLFTLNFGPSTPTGSLCPTGGHEDAVTSLVASHDSRWIVTASKDDTIIVWDTSSGALLHEWLAHQRQVHALALSPDSRRLVSAGRLPKVVVWAIDDGVQKVATLEGHTKGVMACAWSPDGALIASASKDRTVRIWDGHTFQQRDQFSDPTRPHHRTLRFSPDSRYLAWISGNNCRVWRPLMRESPKELRSHPPDRSDTWISALSFDSESRRIVTAHGIPLDGSKDSDSDAFVVRVWDVATGAAIVALPEHSSLVTDISFSPDGRSLLSAWGDGSARVWDAESGEQMALFRDAEDESTILRACFSPDGKHIATWTPESLAGQVRLWRVGDGSCVAIVVEHAILVTHIVFTPCGRFLASGDHRGIVYVYALAKFVKDTDSH